MIVRYIPIGERVWFKTIGPKSRGPSPTPTFDLKVQSINLFWLFLVMQFNLKILSQHLKIRSGSSNMYPYNFTQSFVSVFFFFYMKI